MAFTYTATPSSVARDAVRWLSGQTSSVDDVVIADAEITFALSEGGSNNYEAAALVCDALAARYAAFPTNESVGQLGLSWSDRAKGFTGRAKELRSLRLTIGGISPYVGGISRSDKLGDTQDSDRVPLSFEMGRDDNPNAGWGITQST